MSGTTQRPAVMAWLPWVAFIACVGIFAYFNAQPPLSEEERQMVGVWVGLDTRDPDEPYAWRTELKEDGTLQILFRHFHRAELEETEADQPAASGRWLSERVVEERGRWRIVDGAYVVDSWHVTARRNLWDKLQYFRMVGEWPPGDTVFHEEYVIEHRDNQEVRMRGRPSGALFVERRASPLTELPTEPLPPAQWIK